MCAGTAGCGTAAAWQQHGWLPAPRYTGPQSSHLQQGTKLSLKMPRPPAVLGLEMCSPDAYRTMMMQAIYAGKSITVSVIARQGHRLTS